MALKIEIKLEDEEHVQGVLRFVERARNALILTSATRQALGLDLENNEEHATEGHLLTQLEYQCLRLLQEGAEGI